MINALRAHLAELGIVAAQGREGIKELLNIIASLVHTWRWQAGKGILSESSNADGARFSPVAVVPAVDAAIPPTNEEKYAHPAIAQPESRRAGPEPADNDSDPGRRADLGGLRGD